MVQADSFRFQMPTNAKPQTVERKFYESVTTEKMIQIEIEKEQINFYKDGNSSAIYSIRRAELGQVRKENGNNLSEWIEHLILKSWIEGDALYNLAVIIQNEFPKNNINWEETFFPVEKRLYLNHVKSTKNLLKEKTSKFDFKNLMEGIETGIEEQNDQVNNQVSEIVKINLKKFGLL